MQRQTIVKPRGNLGVPPNLVDYDSTRATFDWGQIRSELDGLPGGGLNIAYEAVERQVVRGKGEDVALRWLGKQNNEIDFTYLDLHLLSGKFANLLDELGVGPGETVVTLAGRIPELYITALGTLKHRSVFSPLFSAFGPEPILQRLNRGEARVLVTTDLLYRQKIAGIRDQASSLDHVLIVETTGGAVPLPENTESFRCRLERACDRYEIQRTEPEDRALLHFTSGTTGMPKGAIHVHEAVLSHFATGRYALDLHPGDVFWCTADPGWVTGTSYGIISPLTHGVTMVIDEAEFDAERWYRNIAEQGVTVWYTAPTAIRMLMKVGPELPKKFDLSSLRFIASVGEPLNPEAVVWGQEVLGLPIHDNWWQTETGGIMVSNFASMDIRPGSMGKPMPGITAGVVRHAEDEPVVEICDPDVEGELALRPGWPSMFRGYLREEARYEQCFRDGWYLSGDLVRKDRDGYLWFVGRADDVIKSSGHLIGPFEVESTLLEHPAVAEAGVIGKPDPTVGEIVKAFVSLKPGFTASEELRLELIGFGRKRLGAVVAPKEIDFLESVPKTRSGKIMRRLLKARELGLPEGDLSTLERL